MPEFESETVQRFEQKLDALAKSSFREKILIAVLPILVAVVSMGLTYKTTKDQLTLSSVELQTTQNFETAKLIAQYSRMILAGGDEAKLARIAFVAVPMSDSQRIEISALLDVSSDSGAGTDDPDSSASGNETMNLELEELLQAIYSENEDVRKSNYGAASVVKRTKHSNSIYCETCLCLNNITCLPRYSLNLPKWNVRSFTAFAAVVKHQHA